MAIQSERNAFVCVLCTLLILFSIGWAQSSAPQPTPQRPPSPPSTAAQSRHIPETTLTVNTRLVSLDVVVTDKSGRPVTDLKKEDFTVLERGQPQQIAVFSLQQSRPADSARSASTKPPAALPPGVYGNRRDAVTSQASLTIVLLDALNTPMADQAYARQQMLKYLKSQHNENQSVAIFGLTSRLLLLQDFTSDPNLLRNAIEKAGIRSSHLLTDPDLDTVEMPGANDSTIASVQEFEQEQTNFQNDVRMRTTMAAMQSIARSVSGYPGRKNLIWVSAAFPLSAAFDGDSSAFFNQSWLFNEVQRTATLLTNSQVSVYPVDARGLVGSTIGSATFTGRGRNGRLMTGPQLSSEMTRRSFALTSSQDAMRQIAESTGGKAYYNRNDIDHAVALSIADGSTYYTVAYYPEDKDWNGSFRKVEVKLSRSGLQTRYRHGYYATDPSQDAKLSKQATLQQMSIALNDPLPATKVEFYGRAFKVENASSQASPAKPAVTPPGNTEASKQSASANKQKITVSFLVVPYTIAMEKRGDVMHFNLDFLVAAFKGEKIVGQQYQTLDANPKLETLKKIMKDGLLFTTAIDVPPGNYRLRLLVRDNTTGMLGALDIPFTQTTAQLMK